jgi:catechol 2,3-dioxygenase-like lactoylglutathione lyase family enzyme
MKPERNQLLNFLQLPGVTQVGIVVPNLEEAILFYREKFFVGSFERIEDFQTLGYRETYYRGEPENFNSTFAFFVLGAMEVEIIEPLSGRSIYQDFLKSGRQGLHHLGFDVYGDLDQRVKAYAEAGIDVLMSGKGPNRAFAYLDTERIGGVIFELLERGGPRKPPGGSSIV